METSAGSKDWPLRLCKRSRSRWDRPNTAQDLSIQKQDLVPAFCSALDLESVIFKILTFLPFQKIYQLRAVCKAWNSLLRSRAFLHAWSAAPHKEWIVMVRELPGPCPLSRELIAYDPAVDRWMSLQHLLSSCPPTALCALGGSCLRCVAHPSLRGIADLSPLAASSGVPGLVCFLISHFVPFPCSSTWDGNLVSQAQDPHVYSLLVLNLLTGSHCILPAPPKQSRELIYQLDGYVSMQLLPHDAYRVFLQTRPIKIYDSCSGSWKVGRSCDRNSDARIASAADLNDADLVQFVEKTCIVYAYSVKLDEWSQVFAEPLDFRFKFQELFRHRGRVFLAAVTNVESFSRGFTVWELRLRHSSAPSAAAPRTPTADWVVVARTPERYWRGFYSADAFKSHIGVRFVSSGGLICMTPVPYTDSGKLNHAGACNPPLVYDLVENSWFHLPAYKGGDDFVAAFCLQPSFTTIV